MVINKNFKHIGLATGVVILGAAILIVLKLTSPLVATKPVIEKVWPVSTQLIKVSSFRPEIKEYGTVIAGSQADLRPLVSGRIIEVGENYF